MRKVFLTIFILSLISCSKSPKEIFNEANELLKEKKYTQAAERFEEIANKNDKEFSPLALIQLATIYHNKMLPDLSESQSAEKARLYFQSVYEKYPEHPDAPKSLFMAAFILANELHQYDEATKLYNEFLKKFPEDELAASAKQELEFIGLSPEEILRKKMAQQ